MGGGYRLAGGSGPGKQGDQFGKNVYKTMSVRGNGSNEISVETRKGKDEVKDEKSRGTARNEDKPAFTSLDPHDDVVVTAHISGET